MTLQSEISSYIFKIAIFSKVFDHFIFVFPISEVDDQNDLIFRREKYEIASSKGGKVRRNKARNAKLATAQKLDLEAHKNGTTYEAGVALRDGIKVAKTLTFATARNPPNTPTEILRCGYFHPSYCRKLGHSSCRAK